jgi:hypothetical protein
VLCRRRSRRPAGDARLLPPPRKRLDLRAPTRVTLKLDHTPVVDALRSLFKQVDIAADDDSERRVRAADGGRDGDGDLVDQPFGVALSGDLPAGVLEPEFINRARAAAAAGDPRPRVCVAARRRRRRAGPGRDAGDDADLPHGACSRAPGAGREFRRRRSRRGSMRRWSRRGRSCSSPTMSHRFSRIDFESDRGVDDPIRTLELNLLVLRDPKLRLIGLGERIDVDEASDDAGVSLLARYAGRSIADPAGREPVDESLAGRAILTYPPGETSRSIAHWSRASAATLISRTQPVELVKDGAAVKPGKAQSAGEVHFQVEKFEAVRRRGRDADRHDDPVRQPRRPIARGRRPRCWRIPTCCTSPMPTEIATAITT